jgi:Dyp-type peroxidase family
MLRRREVDVRAELVVKGRSLTGTSDLTLLAPIIPGLVPSLESITYKTRAKRLLKTLQGGRASLHEYAAYRPLSDAVERVAVIHSFRVVVLEPEDKVLLAVTFDGTWESYIRVLWQKVGTLLDIIFCNTEGYVVSTGTFEEWTGWVRRVQVETSFFFNTHGVTVQDVPYLRGEERIHRAASGGASQDLMATRHCVQSPESVAWDASHKGQDGVLDTLRQGLQSLAVLYRLTDTHLPGTRDGDVLRRAARDLLQEFIPLAYDPKLPAPIAAAMHARFGRQLAWLDENKEPPRPLPKLPDSAATDMYADLQAGILWPHEGFTHGCLLLIAVDERTAGALLLDELIGRVTTERNKPAPGSLVLNVGVTYEGLRVLGLSESQLALFPQEFREGMEARASMLGDFRANHPRRWRLPLRNWNVPAAAAPLAVEMSAVHLVVQLRVGSQVAEIDPTQPGHPLHPTIKQLFNKPGTAQPRDGVRLLSIQGMRRLFNPANQVVEHFGFADGGSDPVFDKADEGRTYRNRVHLGEFLLGRDNESDVALPPSTPEDRERMAWLRDGSFLVVRKLSQRVDVLHNMLIRASAETGLDRATILAKMMGRRQDGTSLADPSTAGNDFDYANDADAARCPFHAHIRRANPRPQDPGQVVGGPPVPPGGRHPRLMRRGMSYGPPFALPQDPTVPAKPDGNERGLVFMAYNASIAEQFEVIQRWISGGNSAGGHSRQSDPFLGVPDCDEQRTYRFEESGVAQRIALDAAPAVNEEPKPFVRLEWGMYLFTPSVTALRKLRTVAAAGLPPAPTWSVDDGEAAVQTLLRMEREQGPDAAKLGWKTLLEDPEAQEKFRSAGAWAAIRAKHGGALRTPYGVLVADRSLAMQVLGDTQGHYSVAGYRERMAQSIGEIYLGLDAGDAYERQSAAANDAISAISERTAFDLALRFTTEALGAFMLAEQQAARMRRLPHWELNLDAKEVCDKVLARLCQEWFGLPADPNGDVLVPGSWRWDWRDDEPPIYPAHFTAPSRYIFQPWPGADVKDYGRRIGAALTAAIARFIAPYRAAGTVPQTPGPQPVPADARLASAILKAFPGPEFDAQTARTFCGALMGFLPTVDGNFRLSLNEWLRDGTFWSLRAAWTATQGMAEFDKAQVSDPLVQAMQLRPSPELVWRRATKGGLRIGEVDVHTGDTIVVSLVSAAQQCLAAGSADVSMVFGGTRMPPPASHPTHACPGYRAGMGVLLGMLSGLLSVKETVRPSPVPLAFTFEG